MKPSPSNPERTKLATGFSVHDYQVARDAQDSLKISEAIRKRFTERYISPVADAEGKNGFAMMAISCLMIEALESFYKGSETANVESAFRSFFARAAPFKEFRGHEHQFYKCVRCGILHQAETTGGWKVIRTGPLFDQATLTINATKFLRKLRLVLDEFCDGLKTAEWDSAVWKNVLKKMDAICKNCQKLPM